MACAPRPTTLARKPAAGTTPRSAGGWKATVRGAFVFSCLLDALPVRGGVIVRGQVESIDTEDAVSDRPDVEEVYCTSFNATTSSKGVMRCPGPANRARRHVWAPLSSASACFLPASSPASTPSPTTRHRHSPRPPPPPPHSQQQRAAPIVSTRPPARVHAHVRCSRDKIWQTTA